MVTRFELDLPAFLRRLRRLEEHVAELSGERTPPRIVVVSKYLSSEDCQALRGEGIGPLGENRAQDLELKVDPGADRDGWHFIGHLQRNKAALVIPRVGCLHSLDSERLARGIDHWVEEHGVDPLPCLVQINVSGEKSKGGLAPFEAREKIPRWIEEYSGIRIDGLMTMAPLGDPEDSRPVFRSLRDLRDEIRADLAPDAGERFGDLSMGMSADYAVAVEEGATLLRVGRTLYEDPTSP